MQTLVLCHPAGVHLFITHLTQGSARSSLHPGLRYDAPAGLRGATSPPDNKHHLAVYDLLTPDRLTA